MLTGRNCLEVQWLGLGAFIAKGLGSIPGQGNKILSKLWGTVKNFKKLMGLVVFLLELMLWKHYTRKNKNINVFHSEKLQWKLGVLTTGPPGKFSEKFYIY